MDLPQPMKRSRCPFRLKTVVGGPVFVLGGISIGLSVTPVQGNSFIVEIGLYVTLGVNDLYLFPGILKGNTIVVFILFQINMVIVLPLELAKVFQLIGGCRQGFQFLLFYLVKKVLWAVRFMLKVLLVYASKSFSQIAWFSSSMEKKTPLRNGA